MLIQTTAIQIIVKNWTKMWEMTKKQNSNDAEKRKKWIVIASDVNHHYYMGLGKCKHF